MSINNINKRLIKLYLTEINYGNKSITKGRPDKEEIDHYIDIIFKVIKTGIPWKALKEKLHYTTYFKKFSKWNNLNLFENIHKIIIKILYNKDLLFIDNKDLYIDSTMIKNINGYEYLGSNHYDRNRNGNKISIIVTKTGIPIGLKLAPANNVVSGDFDIRMSSTFGSSVEATVFKTFLKVFFSTYSFLTLKNTKMPALLQTSTSSDFDIWRIRRSLRPRNFFTGFCRSIRRRSPRILRYLILKLKEVNYLGPKKTFLKIHLLDLFF